jgi:hypothetical protein
LVHTGGATRSRLIANSRPAMQTAARKLAAFRSYRVAMRQKSLRRQNMRSMALRVRRAGSVRLNSFRASISVFLPGLMGFLPHRGWDAGRA